MIATRSILNCLQHPLRLLFKPSPGCPFCLGNDMIPREKIIARGTWAVMVFERDQNIPGTRQIVPRWHKMTTLRWILFLWSALWLLKKNWPEYHFNISINCGESAGQTLPHLHIWLIPRAGSFAGKGLAHFVSLEMRSKRDLGLTLADLLEIVISSQRG